MSESTVQVRRIGATAEADGLRYGNATTPGTDPLSRMAAACSGRGGVRGGGGGGGEKVSWHKLCGSKLKRG